MLILDTLSFPELPEQAVNEDLLKQVGEGSQEAFKKLYENTDKALYGFILSILRNSYDAEEVMQETYMKIWTSASGYQAQGKPLAWRCV